MVNIETKKNVIYLEGQQKQRMRSINNKRNRYQIKSDSKKRKTKRRKDREHNEELNNGDWLLYVKEGENKDVK